MTLKMARKMMIVQTLCTTEGGRGLLCVTNLNEIAVTTVPNSICRFLFSFSSLLRLVIQFYRISNDFISIYDRRVTLFSIFLINEYAISWHHFTQNAKINVFFSFYRSFLWQNLKRKEVNTEQIIRRENQDFQLFRKGLGYASDSAGALW